MERNNNPQTVTLATEMYEELVAMADSSERYTTRRIRRHARKFNPHLQPAHQELVRKNEAFRSKGIVDARQILAKAAGKVVFARTDVNYHESLEDLIFTPMTVKRINKDNRRLLDVYREGELKYGYYNKATVSPDCIYFELPPYYHQICDGPYRTLWVKIGSPLYWYAIEDEAYTENFVRDEYNLKLKRTAESERVHYHDVIGDR